MNRKFGWAAIAVLAVGLGGTAFAGETGSGKTRTTGQKTESTQMKERAERDTAAQRTRAEMESVRVSSLEKDQVKSVQNKLKELGLYKQDADGNWSTATRAAMMRYFNMQLTLLHQDRISSSSLSAFGFAQDEIQRVRGVDGKRTTERQPTKGYEQPKEKTSKEQPKRK